MPVDRATRSDPPGNREAGPELTNILVVDDEPANLLVLETVLDDPSYRIVRAASADQALLALMAQEFAVLVLDVQLPDMNGIELAQMIKERRKTAHLPIIFLTAYFDQDQHRLQGYDSGAVDYLHKPVNPAVLRSKVAVFAELDRKKRELQRANSALQAEVDERRRAQELLRELNETLELRVTERTEALRKSDRKLQAMLNSITDGLLVMQRDGHVAYVNDQGARLLRRSADELVGQHRTAVFADAAFEAGFGAALAGTQATSFEGRLAGADGAWLQCHCYPSDEGLSVYFHDITDRHELQLRREQLLAAEQAARNSADHAAHVKEEFLAAISHELRTPLAAIIGWVNVLNQPGVEPDTLQRGIQAIARNAQSQSVLVADLLEMSRLVAGKQRMNVQRVDLRALIAGVADTARPMAQSRQLAVVLDDEPGPMEMLGDAGRLMQIFMNLVTNAMKFTPAGGTITLLTRSDDTHAEVVIRDTGQGIAAEFLPRLFDRFSQANRAATSVHGGLGLGLSIVKTLVDLHGGEVRAHSAGMGHGAEFSVRFARASPSSDTLAEAAASMVESAEPAVDGVKVLLVDDHADVLEVNSRLLQERGAQVTVAGSAEAAIQALREETFDVLLSDLGMPGMDGYDLIRAVRNDLGLSPSVLPAAAVTAFVRTEDREAALLAGFQLCLQKVVSPRLLARAVAELCDARVSAVLSTPSARRASVSSEAGSPDIAPLRALFVEDNADLREQVAWLLEEEGMKLHTCATAEEALVAYAPEKFDLVVTDVSLPGMSGVDLARLILQRTPDAWVVFSTGYAMGSELASMGPNVRSLLKPFEFADIRKVTTELRQQRARLAP